MKSGSAKHSAEERPSKATTSKKVFLNANGSILIRTIVDMVIRAMAVPSPRRVYALGGGNSQTWMRYRVASERNFLPDKEAGAAHRENGI